MRTKELMIAALAALSMISCNKNEIQMQKPQQMGTIHLSVVDEDVQTKAVTAYTTSQDFEKAVKNVQVFVFGDNGDINIYRNIGSNTTTSISTTAGTKTVWAVVNGPDLASVKTMADLKAKAIDLSDNSKTNGFVIAGSASCTVASSQVSCSVTVSRFVSRVALKKVTNSLPSSLGALQIKNVYLSNVVGNQNLEGTAAASVWYNKEGRADESTRNAAHIIDGATYKASCPELTFNGTAVSIDNGQSHSPAVPYLFYGFPNSSTTKPDGFKATFAAQRTVLVVTASIDGKTQYYPVFLDNATLERNKTYTVELTITGPGSSDPNKEVDKGAASVSISVAEWSAGANYEETI